MGLGLEKECDHVWVLSEIGTFKYEAADDDDHRALGFGELRRLQQGF